MTTARIRIPATSLLLPIFTAAALHGWARSSPFTFLLSLIVTPLLVVWLIRTLSSGKAGRRLMMGLGMLATAGAWYLSLGVTLALNGTASWFELVTAPSRLLRNVPTGGLILLLFELAVLTGIAAAVALRLRPKLDEPGSETPSFEPAEELILDRLCRKRLKLISPLVTDLLDDDENLLALFTATGPLDRYSALLGSSLDHISRNLVLLTSRRLLLLPTTASLGWRRQISEVNLGDLERVDAKGGRLRFDFRTGNSETYQVSRRVVRRLFDLFPSLLHAGSSTDEGERRKLCPGCLAVLRGVTRCGNCALPFRSGSDARAMTWSWPGGGYAYLGYRELAALLLTLELTVVTLSWFFLRMGELGQFSIPPLAPILFLLAGIAVLRFAAVRHVGRLAVRMIPENQPGRFVPSLPGIGRRILLWGRAIVDGAPLLAEEGVRAGRTAAAGSVQLARRIRTAAEMSGRRSRSWLLKELNVPLQEVEDGAGQEPLPSVDWTEWKGIQVESAFLQRLHADREESGRLRDLRKLARILPERLEQGETVLFCSRGASPYTIADYISNILLFFLIRNALFVMTDRRFLLIPCFPDYSPKRSASSFRWGDIAGYAIDAGVGLVVHWKLALQYSTGRREVMPRLSYGDAEVIRSLVERYARPDATRGTFGERMHHCVACGEGISPGMFLCDCGQDYCDPETARTRAIVIPGGGYLYTGHPLIGAVDALVETFLFLNGVALLIAGALGGGGRMVLFGLLFLGILCVEKLVSVHHVEGLSEELVPTGDTWNRPAPGEGVSFWRTGALLSAGLIFFLIGIGVLVRIPHFFSQITVVRHAVWLEEHGPRVERADREIARLESELSAAVQHLRRFDTYRQGRNHTIFHKPGLPFPLLAFKEKAVQSQYDEALNAWRRVSEELEQKRPLHEADVAEYNARIDEIERLEAEIGNTWGSMTPTAVLNDLLRW